MDSSRRRDSIPHPSTQNCSPFCCSWSPVWVHGALNRRKSAGRISSRRASLASSSTFSTIGFCIYTQCPACAWHGTPELCSRVICSCLRPEYGYGGFCGTTSWTTFSTTKTNPLCRKHACFPYGLRGFTKQCCNWISYGVVFLWGNDLETQVSNKLTSRFILSNNSIQIYEISDKKANRIFISLFADLWRTSASPPIIFSFERTGTVRSGHGNRFLKTWIILHILNAEIT